MNKGYTFLLLAAATVLPCFGSSFYIGTDTACFFPTSQTTCTLTSGESDLGSTLKGNPLLSYTPNGGFNAPDTGGTVELGSFKVNDALLGFESGTFDLNVMFTEPGSVGNTYTAKTLGLVVLGSLGAEITFQDPVTQLFTYPGGAFDVSLPSSPILIGAGKTVTLDAIITPVPEPASLGIVCVPLMLLGLALYRRGAANSARF